MTTTGEGDAVVRPEFLRPEAVDLDLLTAELFAKCRALADRDWRLAGTGLGVIVADRQRLTEAVMNLADNAVRHTAPGDVIELGSSLGNGEATIWVRDTGPGVPLDQQDRIFQRFARGHNGGRRPGTAGLGLAIVRSIALAHGGRVALESRPGAGATFTIAIPSGDADHIAEAGPERAGPPRRARRDAHPDRRGRVPHRVVPREGLGRQRLHHLGRRRRRGRGRHRPRRRLRSDDPRPWPAPARRPRGPRRDPPAGRANAGHRAHARDAVPDRVAGLELGSDDYVTKPFSFEELLARVRARLRDDRRESTMLKVGDMTLDLRTRRADVDGRPVELTAREFALTETFMRHPGQVLSREQLLSHVWGYDFDPGSNVVEVYVRYLRRKLGGERIETVRGMGYRFRD